jgi:hypothetical protein
MPNLRIDNALNAKAQAVEDENGNASPLTLATNRIGIGTTVPAARLHVTGAEEGVRVQGLATGNANVAYVSFVDSAGTRIGYVGDGSTGDTNVFLNSDSGDVVLHTQAGRVLTATSTGNVGIGTTNPIRALTIGPSLDAGFTIEPTDGTPNAGYIRFGDGTGWRLHFGRSREASRGQLNTGETGVLMTIQDNGTIFISGDIVFSGADCAEDFDVEDAQLLEPGTVMVIDDGNRLRQSTSPYDTRVAGVLSGAGDCRAGIILGKDKSRKDRLPLALNGKAFCKADAQYAPIGTGDLLTTCATPGHAMKASDPLKAFGAVIGKALQPLAQGRGLIPVLIALH